MRMIYALQSNKAGLGQVWGAMIKLVLVISAALALLVITLIGLFIVLPLMLVGGIAGYFYLRRRLRHAPRRHSRNRVIDAEYGVTERR